MYYPGEKDFGEDTRKIAVLRWNATPNYYFMAFFKDGYIALIILCDYFFNGNVVLVARNTLSILKFDVKNA